MKKITYGAILSLGIFIFGSCGKDHFPNLTPPDTPGVGVETAGSTPDSTSTVVVNYDLSYAELSQMAGLAFDNRITVLNNYDAPYTTGKHRITMALARFIEPMSKTNLGSHMNSAGLWGDVNEWRFATLKETQYLLAQWGPSHRPDSIWIVCMGSTLKNGIGSSVAGSYFAYGRKEDDANAHYGIWYINPGAVWGSADMQQVMGGNSYRVLMVRR